MTDLSASTVYSQRLSCKPHQTVYEWEQQSSFYFNECILSWNAYRPLRGYFRFWLSVKISNEWTEWLLYAEWGTDWQKSFETSLVNDLVHVYQDTLEIKTPYYATHFKIRIEGQEGADLTYLFALHACISDLDRLKILSAFYDSKKYSSLVLDVKGLSQLSLSHPRNRSLCSPTSTTAVLRYLLQQQDKPDVIDFAHQIWDSGFDIFGHWVFNVAQAFVELRGNWQCYVARLNGFDHLYTYLKQNIPVVISVKGQLKQSLMPYSQGHLLVVRGYDSTRQSILCMDPAFLKDEQTLIGYPLFQFLPFWQNRCFLSYVFKN